MIMNRGMVFAGLFLAAAGAGADPATNEIAEAAPQALAEASLADWIVQGGIMMIPIILCSIIALAIILERSFTLRQIRLEAARFFGEIRRIVGAGRIHDALIICENSKSPMARIVKAALLARQKSSEEIRLAVEESAEREAGIFERYLPALGTIGTISPLLGLLGTVLGMIKSSNFLATSGIANTAGLIGGISEALITTAAGLFVAIPVIVCHNWFNTRVNKIMLDMEADTNEILALLEQIANVPEKRVQSPSKGSTDHKTSKRRKKPNLAKDTE
ncbi:MAG: MotA/TolQ/ExbB proton channel family protein [Spirochaetota bacterium]|jgi:biopolymer transport protein ExbB|nr:MotA/TolQ/ExbB proton channel family protein [Spirochaetota bacterium]